MTTEAEIQPAQIAAKLTLLMKKNGMDAEVIFAKGAENNKITFDIYLLQSSKKQVMPPALSDVLKTAQQCGYIELKDGERTKQIIVPDAARMDHQFAHGNIFGTNTRITVTHDNLSHLDVAVTSVDSMLDYIANIATSSVRGFGPKGHTEHAARSGGDGSPSP